MAQLGRHLGTQPVAVVQVLGGDAADQALGLLDQSVELLTGTDIQVPLT